LAVFTMDGTATGAVDFIRSTHINDALRHAATVVYNVTAKADLARFSSHSVRVGACVALHAAGIQQQDIKFALRWKSDSFYTYLRNLPCQASRTAAAVLDFDPQRFTLIPNAHHYE
jgi:dihydrodipicolinate reductase